MDSFFTLMRGFINVLMLFAGIAAPPAFLGLLIASLIIRFKVRPEERIRPLAIILYIATVITFILSVIGIVSIFQFVDGIAHM